MTRRDAPTPHEVATRMALQREEAERRARGERQVPQRAGGLKSRLLECEACHAVWPTERDELHGGSRLDGEPCAYRWADGRVCRGRVWPAGSRPPSDPWDEEPRRSYHVPRGVWVEGQGKWCAELGLPAGTRDLAAVRKAYRRLARQRHPDAGGSHEAMIALNEAYRAALAELAQPGTP